MSNDKTTPRDLVEEVNAAILHAAGCLMERHDAQDVVAFAQAIGELTEARGRVITHAAEVRRILDGYVEHHGSMQKAAEAAAEARDEGGE